MMKDRKREYRMNISLPLSSGLSGQYILQLMLSADWLVLAYMNTGVIMRAATVQAEAATHFEMIGVLYLGAVMGWHTAIYLSALITVRNNELVN